MKVQFRLMMMLALVAGLGEMAMSATTETAHSHTNRLIDSNSPYLLQHAHNPVDWYAWGDEAIEAARREGKPIFLSIGYSACHWCHVMAHESFESDTIAAILNRDFIPIKVDREERPDLDAIYMQAVQMMTGSGGWPLSVWLTPELKPFYGGTYFPPNDGYGRPGFERILLHISGLWKTDRAQIDASSERLTEAIRKASTDSVPVGPTLAAADLELTDGLSTAVREAITTANQAFINAHDAKWGGFGGAPKFPPSGIIRSLLRAYHRDGNEKALEAATQTLDRMAYGGLFDQIGGGFHRYAVDNVWLVPHFEKMLYDNALLTLTYTEAFQITGNSLYRRIAMQTLDYILREMVDADGGFHAAEDADSEGEEGKYYVWSKAEVDKVLGAEDGTFFAKHYGMSSRGNFEGHNILNVSEKRHEDSAYTDADMLRLGKLNAKLREHRHARVHPGRDDKVLAAWNGLMISAFAKGYQVFGDPRYRDAALRAGSFIRSEMVSEGRVLRAYRKGAGDIDGFLDDYGALANAYIDLYEVSFEWQWVADADQLVTVLHDRFQSDTPGAYYYSAAAPDLLIRSKPLMDNQVPSGNTLATQAFLRLGALLGRADYRARAIEIIKAALPLAADHPRAVTHMLVVMDAYASAQTELVLVGDPEDRGLLALLGIAYRQFDPARLVLLHDPRRSEEPVSPLLQNRPMVDNQPTVYLCHDSICKKPMTSPDEFATVLTASDRHE